MLKRGDTLAVRLALSFVAVAVLAVAIGAALVVALAGHDVNVMIKERRSDLSRSLAVDAASTYNSGQAGWSDADLTPALELASQSGTDVAILDNDGHTVASTISDPTLLSDSHRRPITLNGQQIGTLVVKFNHRGLVGVRRQSSALLVGRSRGSRWTRSAPRVGQWSADSAATDPARRTVDPHRPIDGCGRPGGAGG